MVKQDQFMSLEARVDALEQSIIEIQMLVKILKPIAILLGASLGLDIQGLLL